MDAKADLLGGAGRARRADGGADRSPPDAPGFYHPGRSGVVRQGPKTVLGHVRRTASRACWRALDLAGPAAAFELFLDAVPSRSAAASAPPDLPAFQPVRRDFAFLVDAAVPAETVLRAARGAERTLIAGVTLFDVYEGGAVPAGKTLARRSR